ncbi:MAG TPA: hypothetical protein VHG53_02465 [Candidatus Limnocylindria bacterium]|nr:hypothetical protein [Candidatus Limnocylindria bacterium]
MTLGFLGTVIGLERAVALGRRWPYLAPVLSGAGALALVGGAPVPVGGAALALAGAVLATAYLAVGRRAPEGYVAIMALGAVAWITAAILWSAGWAVSSVVPLLAAFLVLTIVGERLQLARLSRPDALGRAAFALAVAVFALGVGATLVSPAVGVRVAGAGLVLLALWLARFDVARASIRRAEPARYIAISLLSGYAWLAVAGALWLAFGPQVGGPAYDAMLHALFLGFVLSMVFGHEVVIVPAVLGIPLRFGRAFYVPLALIHGSLLARVAADLAGATVVWQWSGAMNVVAILAFIGVSVAAARPARRGPPRALVSD